LIFRCPPSLSTILIARVGAKGDLRPIDPCDRCQKLADNRGIKIKRVEVEDIPWKRVEVIER